MVFDTSIFNWLYGLAEQFGLLRFFFVLFADYLIYGVAIACVVSLFFVPSLKRKVYFGSMTILSLVLSYGIITPLFRFFHERLRPFTALDIVPFIDPITSSSFPSGHMAVITPLACAVVYMYPTYKWWAILAVALTGIGRIAVGVHWPTDILGGIAFGVLSFFAALYLLKKKY
jgi:undecaprenyl-diphosphatase